MFARAVGRSEQQCAGATRLVAQRVRAALADVLRGEGVAEHELDAEIARVRRVLWVRALRIRRIRQVESRLSMVRSTLQFDESRLRRFCAEKGIRRIRVYGSAVRPDFDAARSDIDLLIDFQPGKTPGFAFFALGEELAEILGRRVDVNTEQMLSRHFRDEVLSEAELLYDAA